MNNDFPLPDVPPRVQYSGDGQQREFPFRFRIFDARDLRVFVGDFAITGFTVTGIDDPSGGKAILAEAPPSGSLVTLMRSIPLQRVSDFQESGAFRARVINDELNYQTAMTQQVAQEIGRALKLSPTTRSGADLTLPEPSGGAYLRWSPDGQKLETATAAPNAATVQQSGRGAVERLITAKLGERLSVKDFGAMGNGVADDTAAIQAAIDSISPPAIAPGAGDAGLTGGGVVFFPRGVYRITDTLRVGPFVKLQGEGRAPWLASWGGPSSGTPEGSVIYADFNDSTKGMVHVTPYVTATGRRFTGSNTVTDSDHDIAGTYTLCPESGLFDLCLYARKHSEQAPGAAYGLRLTLNASGTSERVAIYNCASGVIGEANWESALKAFLVQDFTTWGYRGFSGQHAINFDNWWVHGGRFHIPLDQARAEADARGNVYALRPAGFALDWGAGCTITAPSLESLSVGVSLSNTDGITILGGQCERVHNLLKANNGNGIRWQGGDLYNPSGGAMDYSGSTVIDGASAEVVVDGLVIRHPHYGPGQQGFPGKWFGRNLHDYPIGRYTVIGEDYIPGETLPDIPVGSGFIRILGHSREQHQGWYEQVNANGRRFHRGNSPAVWMRGSAGAPLGLVIANSVALVQWWGSPEGWVAGEPGSLVFDNLNGKHWRKASGTGNTGWVENA